MKTFTIHNYPTIFLLTCCFLQHVAIWLHYIDITYRARLSRCYSFLNPFQRIIRVADNEPDEFRRICKQISGGTN